MNNRWAKKVLVLIVAAVMLLMPVTPSTIHAQKSNSGRLGGPGSGSSSALDCAVRDSGDYTFDWYGTVINHQTNKTIPKITIKATLPSGKAITAISGIDGKYAFTPGLQLGQSSAKVPVSLSGNDYQTEEYVINVTPGKFSKDLLLDEKFNEASTGYKRLYNRVLIGKLVLPNPLGTFLPYTPVSGATVSLYDNRDRHLVANATTNVNGIYYFTQAPTANLISQNVDYYSEASLDGTTIASQFGITTNALKFVGYPGGSTLDNLISQLANTTIGSVGSLNLLFKGSFIVGLTSFYQGTSYTYPLLPANDDLTITQNDTPFKPFETPPVYFSQYPDITYLAPITDGLSGAIVATSKLQTGPATLTLTHNGIQLSQKQITIHAGFNYIDLTLTKPLLCGTVSEKDIDIPLAGLDITFTQGSQTQKVASNLDGQYASYQETTKSQSIDIDNGGTRHYEIEPVGNFANMTPKIPIQYNAVGDPAVSTIFDMLAPTTGTINFNGVTTSSGSSSPTVKKTAISLQTYEDNTVSGKIIMNDYSNFTQGMRGYLIDLEMKEANGEYQQISRRPAVTSINGDFLITKRIIGQEIVPGEYRLIASARNTSAHADQQVGQSSESFVITKPHDEHKLNFVYINQEAYLSHDEIKIKLNNGFLPDKALANYPIKVNTIKVDTSIIHTEIVTNENGEATFMPTGDPAVIRYIFRPKVGNDVYTSAYVNENNTRVIEKDSGFGSTENTLLVYIKSNSCNKIPQTVVPETWLCGDLSNTIPVVKLHAIDTAIGDVKSRYPMIFQGHQQVTAVADYHVYSNGEIKPGSIVSAYYSSQGRPTSCPFPIETTGATSLPIGESIVFDGINASRASNDELKITAHHEMGHTKNFEEARPSNGNIPAKQACTYDNKFQMNIYNKIINKYPNAFSNSMQNDKAYGLTNEKELYAVTFQNVFDYSKDKIKRNISIQTGANPDDTKNMHEVMNSLVDYVSWGN